MKKIPSLFVRDYERKTAESKAGITEFKGRFLATEQVTPGCEWVINGEGIATRKWDGTAIRIHVGDATKPMVSKRYDAKHGKTPPPDFEPCQDPDPVTGHWPGWIPCDPCDPADKYIAEAYENTFIVGNYPVSGTYELVGPKINGNKDRVPVHMLIMHGYQTCEDCPRDFDGIKQYLDEGIPIEGIVFHHPDGRMCKVKRSDFGLPW